MAKNDEQQFQVSLNPEKTQIVYTDTIFMNVNDDGVTFDICQKVGNSNQVQVVSRIGMSRDHAQKFVKKLTEILVLTHGHSRTTDKN
ncbi:MAG: hypothetical protein Q7T54_03005 [Candidatus Levybacteria bacterium]|nr:hypothetical protein [Candidatus Levybacteria bacterium]